MKTIKLEVTLEFDGHIYDDQEIKEVVENVYHAIDSQFITPHESDVMVSSIEVVEPFSRITFKRNV